MKFWFISRASHEEMVTELRSQIANRERELHRLRDLIFKNAFGVQLHDTLPETVVQPEPEPVPLSPEKEAELKMEQEQADEKARLTSIWRTRPSQLGPALENAMKRKLSQRAQAARPVHTVSPASAIFGKAKEEALN